MRARICCRSRYADSARQKRRETDSWLIAAFITELFMPPYFLQIAASFSTDFLYFIASTFSLHFTIDSISIHFQLQLHILSRVSSFSSFHFHSSEKKARLATFSLDISDYTHSFSEYSSHCTDRLFSLHWCHLFHYFIFTDTFRNTLLHCSIRFRYTDIFALQYVTAFCLFRRLSHACADFRFCFFARFRISHFWVSSCQLWRICMPQACSFR